MRFAVIGVGVIGTIHARMISSIPEHAELDATASPPAH
jgi:hypothetical protein